MKNQRLESKRRALLKSTAAAGGLMVFGKAAPESWMKPVVNAIVLPAHAQTTQASDSSPVDTPQTPPPEMNPCVGDSITLNADQFAVNVNYDGVSAPTFFIRDSFTTRFGNDAILGVSRRPDYAIGIGSNWEMLNSDPEANIFRSVEDGLYAHTSRRLVNGVPTGDTYEITFCIATAGEGATRTMTLTLVSVGKI